VPEEPQEGLAPYGTPQHSKLLKTEHYTHWILTNLLHKESGIQVSIFNLYVPVLPEEKKDCWNKLREFLNMHQIENIIIVGDLNVTLSQGKKKGEPLLEIPSVNGLRTSYLIGNWKI
jgi:hypothetical protein